MRYSTGCKALHHLMKKEFFIHRDIKDCQNAIVIQYPNLCVHLRARNEDLDRVRCET
jgi:hypothetical protein